MPNKGFNGTTCSIATTTYSLYGVELSIACQKVDVSQSSKANMLYEIGLPDYELTVEIRGATTPSTTVSGAVALAWNDGVTATLPGTFLVNSVRTTGRINDSINSTVTLCPNTT